jgi:hypothetical protein
MGVGLAEGGPSDLSRRDQSLPRIATEGRATEVASQFWMLR